MSVRRLMDMLTGTGVACSVLAPDGVHGEARHGRFLAWQRLARALLGLGTFRMGQWYQVMLRDML